MTATYTPGNWDLAPVEDGPIRKFVLIDEDRNSLLTIVYDEGVPFAAFYRDADARRVVACVNALDGLPQDALDGGWAAKGASAYAKRLEGINADLLAALELLLREEEAGTVCEIDRQTARAAIAKARSQS